MVVCYVLHRKNNSTDYHDEMNSDNFHEWFKSIIPRLKRNSVIVMDNAPYHSVRSEKIPTNAWKKNDIVNWLVSKGIQVDAESMIKGQLLVKVNEIKKRYLSYVVDNMAIQYLGYHPTIASSIQSN